jgi:RNA polymerase sigma factor (sigma-70 family)
LYRTHRLAMVRLAVLLVDDTATAEDVVQDAFIGLHRHSAKIDGHAAVSYLRRSVINGSHSALRRRRTMRRHLTLADSGSAEPSDSVVLLAEEQRAVVAAVRALPTRQREVVVLRYWANLSEAEIADALRISRGAVKSTASKGVARIAQLIGDK